MRCDTGGLPQAVCRRRAWVRVAAVVECWRIDDEWWHIPISRLYYRLQLQDGGRVVVFYDLVAKVWYEQRVSGPVG